MSISPKNSSRENSSREEKIKVKGDDLTKVNIFSYGIGHFLNDLCAACWFFFLSYYLVDIINIKEYAGYVMLAGQVADAIATPLVGIFSDKTNTSCGKRTPWYICGTFLVVVSFTLIFVKVIPDDSSDALKLAYYIIFPSLFNIGWAAVQVSHMALLPSITLNKKNKDLMIKIRTGFTFLAQTSALILSFFLFWLIKDKLLQYEALAISCVAFGILTSVVFLILCKEKKLSQNIPTYLEEMRSSLTRNKSSKNLPPGNTNSANEKGSPVIENNNNIQHNSGVTVKSETPPQIKWTYWLNRPDFYAYMIVYMFCRLSINITQSVIPFYIQNILGYEKTPEGGTPVQIAIVLLISTIASILNSLVIQTEIEKKIKNPAKNTRLILLLISFLFVLVGCVPMYFLSSEFPYPIYGLAFLFGIGFSMGLSTVSSCINDVVGSKGAQGAFVYGAYSFADKLSCGIVLAIYLPLIKDNYDVLKYTLPIFPPVSLFFALIIVFIRWKQVNKKEREEAAEREKLLEREEHDKAAEYQDKKIGTKSFIDDSRFTFVTHFSFAKDNDPHNDNKN
jgi:Na+/melibiose symporter-like transporter